MTVYNGGRYLRQAVESVLGQRYGDFEFVIVNDSSIDGSLEVLKSYSDPRIRIVSNPSNLGQTRSLNVGLRAAQGEFIARMDADDAAQSQWLEKLVAFARRRPECVVWSAWAFVIDEKGGVQRLLKVPAAREEILLRALTATPINHGGCLMKHDAILKQGGYREDLKVVADFELWSQLLRSGYEIAVLAEPLTAIRFHGGSISQARKYDVVASETMGVLRKNIKAWSEAVLSEEELLLFWKVLYDQASLGAEDNEKGKRLVVRVYEGLRPILGISRDQARSFVRGVLKALDGKRAYAFIEQGDRQGLRTLCRQGQVGTALRSLAFFSFPGMGVLRMARDIFDFFRRLEACFKGRCCYHWFHYGER